MGDLSSSYNKFLHSLFNIPPANRTQEDLEEIMKYTKDSKFLKKICQERNSDRVHWECCRVMALEVYEQNHQIFKIGEASDRFFILIKGKVNVVFPGRSLKRSQTMIKDIDRGFARKKTSCRDDLEVEKNPETEKHEVFFRRQKRLQSNVDFELLANFGLVDHEEQINTLGSEDFVGEISLLDNKPRIATVEAKETCYFAVVSKRDFHRILCTDGAKSLEERVDLLKALPAFSKVTNVSLQKLALSFSEVTYRKDQKIYDEVDLVENIYFVKSGEFKLSQGDIISTHKYSESNDIFLRLSQMKKLKKRVNQREVIKGKNEIFGYEELIEQKDKRLRKCSCYSNFGVVYEMKVETFKKFTCYQEIITFLKSKYQNDYIRSSTNLGPLKEIEKFKQSTSPKISLSGKVQDILYRMRNKEEFSFTPKAKSPIKMPIPTPSFDNNFVKSESEKKLLGYMKGFGKKNWKSFKDGKPAVTETSRNLAHKTYLKGLLKNVQKKSKFDCVSPVMEEVKKVEFHTPRNDLIRWSFFDWVI